MKKFSTKKLPKSANRKMKLNFGIPKGLVEELNKELQHSKGFFAKRELQLAWRHLERAHILGQSSPYQHSRVHWLMLMFAFRIKNTREILGQIPRLLFGGVKSFVGTIPIGNTGGANVPPLRPMEIPEDLKQVLIKHSVKA
jgi:hypothetical protein